MLGAIGSGSLVGTVELMSMLHKIAVFTLLATAVSLGTGLQHHAKSRLTRFQSVEGSKVRVGIVSTVVDVEMESSSIDGWLETDTELPLPPSGASPRKVAASAAIQIPVRSLTNMRDSKPFGLDEQTHRKLKPDKHPNILVFLREFELGQPTPKDPPEYKATGEIVLAGVTNGLSIALKIVALPDQRLELSGQKTIRMSDFGIDRSFPVPVCFSPGKELRDEVEVSFKWILSKSTEIPK
jgi:hypothetical protein